MTTPASGPISMSQIGAEFGLPRPTSLSQMRGKGDVAGSGPISFGQLRGKSSATLGFSPPPGTYDYTEYAAAVGYSIQASLPVVWTWSKATGDSGTSTASPASGGTGQTWVGNVTAGRNTLRRGYFNVTATYNGQSYNWLIRLVADNTGGSTANPDG